MGNEPHVVVEARAGSGKTSTLVGGIQFMLTGKFHGNFQPSQQQKDIWSAMRQKIAPKSAVFCAFNRSIADELKNRVPDGCTATTIHSLGYGILRKNYTLGKYSVTKKKTSKILERLTGKDIRELWKYDVPLVHSCQRLTSLCKMTLADQSLTAWEDVVDELAGDYGVDMKGYRSDVIGLVPQILSESRNLPPKGQLAFIDYDDMVWIPVVNDLLDDPHEIMLVDEAQDLNPCQQTMVLSLAERLIFCGDPKQAIYGFTGADTDSMFNLTDYLRSTERGVVTLPLSYTYRCGHAIVAQAQRLVPDFYAAESNPKGSITRVYRENMFRMAESGDMVICRVNAPLVGACFQLVRMGKSAFIVGQDIGAKLIEYIEGFPTAINSNDVDVLLALVEADCQFKIDAINQQNKKNGPGQIIMIRDQLECITFLCDECSSVKEILTKIEEMFTDEERGGIRLSSGHRSKGLEADTVFFLYPELIPHPLAKSDWEKEQELNLKYVMITRAINNLVYVVEPETIIEFYGEDYDPSMGEDEE